MTRWTNLPPTESETVRLLYEEHLSYYEVGKGQRVRYRRGLQMLLAWLCPTLGQSWQEIWEARVENGGAWADLVAPLASRERNCLYMAVQVLVAHRVVRPGYNWLLNLRFGHLYYLLFDTTERDTRDRIAGAARDLGYGVHTLSGVWILLGRVLAHTGKALDEITSADLVELRAAANATGHVMLGHFAATRILFHLGIVRDPLLSPGYFRTVRPSVDQLIDSFGIRNRVIRDVFVLYFKEREASLDFNSLRRTAHFLVRLFWCDIEAHHPEVAGLDLPGNVTDQWRRRIRLLPGGRPRANVEAIFFTVRAFYLDLLQWSTSNPAIWAQYACRCPIRASDLASHRKSVAQQRARTHARIRMLQPLLARFVAHVRERRAAAKKLLVAAGACPGGSTFQLDGVCYIRQRLSSTPEGRLGAAEPVMVIQSDGPAARILNCRILEDRAFWAWAVTEILRLTGLRCEEMLELTHVSLRDHRMNDGKRVLLLQIAPSKQDRERVLPVCPELAHVLAQVIERVRGSAPRIPCVPRYDPCERSIGGPLPYLFQGGPKRQRGVFCRSHIRQLLCGASSSAGLRDTDGNPIEFQPHDFRRLLATEAVNSGLPLHIAAKLLGHTDLNTTRGYVAVYEEEVVRQYQTHLARRRTFRPPHEYREPTAAEWSEFGEHFRRRRMALGDCYRPYGTDCPHEHACIRCSQLRVDPTQLPRLREIEADTHRLLNEARGHGWEGELAGLEVTLVHTREKKAQAERIEHEAIESNVRRE